MKQQQHKKRPNIQRKCSYFNIKKMIYQLEHGESAAEVKLVKLRISNVSFYFQKNKNLIFAIY